ncbi:hypothetical protein LTR17_016637 [Elasticomyces elasticus]|nr:hypothetical protein LTR17_016637 [Elasticomyces elasticus]
MYDTFEEFSEFTEFSAEDGHCYIEVDATDITSPEFRTRTLNHAEIEPWLATVHANDQGAATHLIKPRLRLFIARPLKVATPNRSTFPLSLQSLRSIAETFGVPSAFVNYALSHTTVNLNFDGSDVPTINGIPSQCTGVIALHASLAVAVVTNTKTLVTSAIALGLCDHQTSQLIAAMRANAQALGISDMLPIAWLNIIGQTRARRVWGRKAAIVRSELDLGIHWSVTGLDVTHRVSQAIDYDLLTRQLTVMGSEIGWDTHAIDAQLDMALCFERFHGLLKLRVLQDTASQTAHTVFHNRLQQARQQLLGSKYWTAYNQRRVEVQLQTVYSLISQRDNDINYATAVASQRIAEASQRDSAVMKQLSEDSRLVALHAWRDGIDMRIMAAVTLFTLPGTFAATLFSTSFSNFQPSRPNTVVSPWIWLYGVVTVGLTAIFMATWYVANRAMRRRVAEAVPSAAAENSTHESGQDGKSVTHSTAPFTAKVNRVASLPKDSLPHGRPLARPSRSVAANSVIQLDFTLSNSGSSTAMTSEKALSHDTVTVFGLQGSESLTRACARCAAPVH